MSKFKSNKGITLVALIITIIVLLILAMVSINLVMNGGIIDKSKNAVDKYSEEEIAEQIKLAYQEYQMSQYTGTPLTLQQAMDNAFGAGVATVSGDATSGWTVTVGGKSYPLAANGTVGEGVEVGKVKYKGQTIGVGDYVNYDPTLNATGDTTYTSYSVSSAEANPTRNEGRTSGYTEDQTFDAATYKSANYGWRVLDVKNGKIRLISEEFVGPGTYSDQSRTKYYLQGQKGYINGIEELNAISAIFGHGTGAESATSVTVDDVNAITGFNPNSPKFNQGSWNEYNNPVTYTYNSENSYTATRTNGANAEANTYNFSGSFTYFNNATRTFVPLTSGSTTVTSTYYNADYNNSSALSKAGVLKDNGRFSAPYEMLFGDYEYDKTNNYERTFKGTTEQSYWLASEYAYAYDYYAYWGLRYVRATGVHSINLYDSYGSTGSYGCGVRPVVTLSSSVNLKWNATAGEWQIQ